VEVQQNQNPETQKRTGALAGVWTRSEFYKSFFQDSSGVRDVFVAAWAPYFDKWKDVDPGVAKICKMYVQYSLDTDLLVRQKCSVCCFC
jgi:hypothetical protein